jgi:hypothetical protein
MLALNDEQRIEHRHSAIEIERKLACRIRVGAGELDVVTCHVPLQFERSCRIHFCDVDASAMLFAARQCRQDSFNMATLNYLGLNAKVLSFGGLQFGTAR